MNCSFAVKNMRRRGLLGPGDPVPVSSSRRSARYWPSAGLRGDQRVCRRTFLGFWVVACPCGRTHLPYTCVGLLRWQRHPHNPCVPGWHVPGGRSATEVMVRAWLTVPARRGPPCSDNPSSGVEIQDLDPWPRGSVTGHRWDNSLPLPPPSGVRKEGHQQY